MKARRLALLLAVLVWPLSARAGGLTETLPRNTFMLDVSFYFSQLSHAYDNDGNLRPLFDELPRYEPGGGLQGTIIPEVDVTYNILALQLQYGIVGLGHNLGQEPSPPNPLSPRRGGAGPAFSLAFPPSPRGEGG